MGILGSIVQALVRAMLDAGHDIAFCGAIGSELVGDHHTWQMALTLKKLSHQAFCSLGIAATLHQGVENKTILIDGTPEPVFLSLDGDDDLVEMLFVAELAGGSPPYFIGEMPTEFLRPKSHSLVRHHDAAFGQQIFDHTQAQRKPETEPNRMGNHASWKSVTTITS
jgi:hypothetical protein